MDFEERLGWMLIGCGIGFILGYLVRTLQAMKGEIDEVDGLVKRKLGDRKTDEGLVRYPLILDVALAIVVGLTVWAAFSSQRASNDAETVQKDQAVFVTCNSEYLSKTIRALNERTSYATDQAQANIELQRAQSQFLAIILAQPPVDDDAQRRALQRYFDGLTKYIDINSKVAQKAVSFPYPTNEELRQCLGVP